eukprot:gene1967-biopygen1620
MGERARKELEKIVHQALIDNGIYETDNSGGSIVGVSDSPFAVVNCCVAVRKAVSELRLQSAGPEAEPVPVMPISMGVATGLCTVEVVKEGLYRVGKFRGRCVMEASYIATNHCLGRILLSESTWYAMSDAEGEVIEATFINLLCHFFLSRSTKAASNSWRGHYVITGLSKTRAEEESTTSTIVIHNPYRVMKNYFGKAPQWRRTGLLSSILVSFGDAVPPSDLYDTDEQYAAELMHRVGTIVFGQVDEVLWRNETETMNDEEEFD